MSAKGTQVQPTPAELPPVRPRPEPSGDRAPGGRLGGPAPADLDRYHGRGSAPEPRRGNPPNRW